MRIDAPAAGRPARLPLIDAARGAAIVAMAIYHFSWDLRFFGYIAADVAADPGWRIFARLIAGSFLFLSGVSLVLSARNGLNRGRFLRRLAVIAAAAAAVTVATLLVFPDAFIFFGILHAIAVSSVLGLLFLRAPVLLVMAAALFCFVAPRLLAAEIFNAPALLWLGLFTEPPRSNDFVPVFPWFGVVLAGMAVARLASRPTAGLMDRLRHPPVPRLLVLAGRWSLPIYLVHQPILIGLVYLATQVAPPTMLAFKPGYVETCAATCAANGSEASACTRNCQCVADEVEEAGFWREFVTGALNEGQVERYVAIEGLCTRGDGG